MKKRNKEELIEYFIEQLGDNRFLGKIMSVDQIREKLNSTIKEVVYDNKAKIETTGNCIFDLNDRTLTIAFDSNQISSRK